MSSGGEDRNALIWQAKLAEQAERYDDMADAMKRVAAMGGEPSAEDRNLLSVAYKNVIGARRASWRILSSIEQKEVSRGNDSSVALVREYRTTVEKELHKICEDVLDVIQTHLIPSGDAPESKVFYLKMAADYYRYQAEFQQGDGRKKATEESLASYNKASETASELQATHPIRLGLALNFSVFYFEILNAPERACKLAQAAYEDAIAGLDSIQDETYKDSTLILQLIKDNLALWTTDVQEEGGDINKEVVQDLEDEERAEEAS